jgi:hypothetical protein
VEGVARGIDCWSLEERERKQKKFEEDKNKSTNTPGGLVYATRTTK